MRGSAIVSILSGCADAEISPSIIQTVTVYVVDDETFGGIHNLAVHCDSLFRVRDGTIGIVFFAI